MCDLCTAIRRTFPLSDDEMITGEEFDWFFAQASDVQDLPGPHQVGAGQTQERDDAQ